MIIVCTAAILLDCLHHSFIRMNQVNLLIFDEAHHTKKNHPYARIIKDFYVFDEHEARRPRIFGMTASPVDARTDVTRASRELETLLDSEIATVADPEALQRTICKPKTEELVQYQHVLQPLPTQLTHGLKNLVGSHGILRKQIAFADYALRHLGPWCVDRFWQISLRPEELVKFEAKTERSWSQIPRPGASMDADIQEVRDAVEMVRGHSFAEPSPELLSDKVRKLHSTLHHYFVGSGGEAMRCIVFVEQRLTAMMLADLFQQEGMRVANLHVDILVRSSGMWFIPSLLPRANNSLIDWRREHRCRKCVYSKPSPYDCQVQKGDAELSLCHLRGRGGLGHPRL